MTGKPLLTYSLQRNATSFVSKLPPAIYLLEKVHLGLTGKAHRLVSADSRLVIEGPPRCGNSSALRLVTRANPEYKKRVATHIHRSFQLRYARRWGVPAVVMLRAPRESTVSHAALLTQLGQVEASTPSEREKLLLLCVEEYLTFARNALDLQFRHVVAFEDHIADPRYIIGYLNRAFGLGLSDDVDEASDMREDAVHVMPNEEREEIKQAFKDIAANSPLVRTRIAEAQQYYEQLMAQRVTVDGQ